MECTDAGMLRYFASTYDFLSLTKSPFLLNSGSDLEHGVALANKHPISFLTIVRSNARPTLFATEFGQILMHFLTNKELDSAPNANSF